MKPRDRDKSAADPEAAPIERLRRKAAKSPHDAPCHLALGEALLASGDAAGAIVPLERAVWLEAFLLPAWRALGEARRRRRDYQGAETALRHGLARVPADDPRALPLWRELGIVFAEFGLPGEAVGCFRRVLVRAPDADTFDRLGVALVETGRAAEAREAFFAGVRAGGGPALRLKAALALPIVPGSRQEIAAARESLARELDALAAEGARIADPLNEVARTGFYLAYNGADDRALLERLARFHLGACPSLAHEAPHVAAWRGPQGRIRLGLVSTFFHGHTIGRLNRGLVENLSRERFEVTVFATPAPDDEERRAIRAAAGRFVELPQDRLSRARRVIEKERLDVLYYPDVGMAPLTYFLSFARLAPAQCVGWGHPDTPATPGLDRFLSCAAMEPEGAEAHYAERLVRLPGPTLFWTPPPRASAKDRAAFGLPAAATLYLCPQSVFKFHPEFDAVLARILAGDARGRLVILRSWDRNLDRLLAERMGRAGIDVAGRVSVLDPMAQADYLALLACCDVMLDPLHYSGGQSSLEAFSVGLPIVTWPGAFMRARHSYGFYRLMGIDEAVARDPGHYVEIALGLGADPARRAALSARIAEAAPRALFAHADSVRAIEDALAEAVAAAQPA